MMKEQSTSVDYQAWATAMCTLLDRVEMVAEDEKAVRELCKGRFDLAREHGLTVEVTGPASGRMH